MLRGFDIELYKGDSFKSTLLNHAFNDGYASFKIPEDFKEGDDYKIKITDENSNEYDFSGQFSIKHPKIRILYPLQGDIYIPHTTRSIFWTSSGVNSKVSIELFLNSSMIILISNETSNNGEFRWAVWQGKEYAQNTYSTYQIQIKDTKAQKYIDSSPFFTITNERYMNILSPTQNSSFTTRNYLNISWKTDSTAYRVSIKIMQNNSIIENITDVRNNGFYQWKIPDRFKDGEDYYVRIDVPDNSVNATSELFTIKYIPKLKVSGYNIPLFSIIIGFLLGMFSFKYKSKKNILR